MYVCFWFRLSYRKREQYGLDKIPTDGPYIYAPNHTNALMDALAVLSIDLKPKVFVARADIFKIRWLAPFLRFLKIMPINRIRDGRNTLKDNDEIIKLSVDVLKDNVPFCILPEGTHRAMHSLLPLGKGVFRIALMANQEVGAQRPVYIVPVGLEYGNFFRYRSSLMLQIGDPINVTQFVADHPEWEPPVIMNHLKEKLTQALRKLILYIPDDTWYDATWDLCNLLCNKRLKQMGLKRNLLANRLLANQTTVRFIQTEREERPEKAEKFLEKAVQFAQERKAKNISMASVANPNPLGSLLLRCFYMIVTLPYFLASAVLSAPSTLVARLLCSKMKDAAFHNSVRYVINLFLWTLVFLVVAVFAFCYLPIELALAACLAGFFAPVFFEHYKHWARISLSDARWIGSRDLRKLRESLITHWL